ncbi:MAG TPA: cupin domain-containing protein [Anaerolineae bacterium]|nr:cupin domain-containing protein [Anaerolineae bacterium]
MKTMHLLEGLEFHDKNPNAEPLHVDKNGRVLRFMLKPGQSITEHSAPSSPFYVVVLRGQGMFAGGDGQEQKLGPNTLLIFDPGENHVIRALDEELVFVGFLQGVPGMRPGKVGGKMARQRR